jgi:hypothetical protein
MEPARRLIQGDARQWERTDQVVSRHPGQTVPAKTDRTSGVGCSPPGRRQKRREQDARARECLDDAGGLELFRLPLLPDRGVAEPLGDAILAVAGAGGIFNADGSFAAEEVEVAPLVGLQHVVEEEAAVASGEVGRPGLPLGAAAGRWGWSRTVT